MTLTNILKNDLNVSTSGTLTLNPDVLPGAKADSLIVQDLNYR
jgi:ABC-type Zn2+ transport system substrate-binding protein/surface adhesin